jgi:hypothetical protein
MGRRTFHCDVGRKDHAWEDEMAQGPWFYCLKHHTVEDRDGCAERHRLGPYETREEAEHALQSVAEREERLTAEDRRWREGD